MRALIQRVLSATVRIEGRVHSNIESGLLILLGVEHTDTHHDVKWLVEKLIALRIFPDNDGKMNLSLSDSDGQALIVSQFTLHASTKKGNRPSFINAARPVQARSLYEQFITEFERNLCKEVSTGEFGSNMQIELVNDGPVTLMIDTKNKE